jgi:hypothetical protein
MPLPEDEQRQLREIERALYQDDPKFARRIRAGDPRMRSKRALLRVVPGVVIGAGLLTAGAVTDRAYLEAAGVVIVLLALVAAMVSRRRDLAGARTARSGAGTTAATGTKRRPGHSRRARMTGRMDQRWRRRQDGDGGRPGPTRR